MDEKKSRKIILEPSQRLRSLADSVCGVEVDVKTPAIMYLRSGMQMLRMADMHLKQGSLKDAYLLYIRFMTLFLEKIRDHPGWAALPIQDRKLVSDKIKEVMPKSENLKERLRLQFEKEYLQQVTLREEGERKADESEVKGYGQKLPPKTPRESLLSSDSLQSDVVTGPNVPLDSIIYPDADNSLSSKDEMNQPFVSSTELVADQSGPAQRLPTVNRSNKPVSLLSLATRPHLGLRNVVVPSQLVERFLVLAQATTLQNVEACGILAGYLDQNQLVISHLIVPKQHGTADSCSTENEEEVFSYQDKHNLITLGWIHTHPSQTAFLSSVDLHTHCSYQLMMPEAIAIVCAPRYKDNSIFCLTQNYGLDFIAKCSQPGFHPHPTEPPLFTIAEHARLESDTTVDVVDLR